MTQAFVDSLQKLWPWINIFLRFLCVAKKQSRTPWITCF